MGTMKTPCATQAGGDIADQGERRARVGATFACLSRGHWTGLRRCRGQRMRGAVPAGPAAGRRPARVRKGTQQLPGGGWLCYFLAAWCLWCLWCLSNFPVKKNERQRALPRLCQSCPGHYQNVSKMMRSQYAPDPWARDRRFSTRREINVKFWQTEPDAMQGGRRAAMRALQALANAAARRS